MGFRILVLSRDAQLFLLLQHVLATEGFAASLTDACEDSMPGNRDDDVRAVIVDCSDTGADADALCALKRKRRELAFILLVNQDAESAASAFDAAGPDLILGRPFNPALLVRFLRRLRLDALIEKGGAEEAHRVLHFADLEMNTAAVRVRRSGHDVPLSALQFRLLRHLLQNPGAVQSREQLIAAGWSAEAEVEPRTVDIHIGHIRRALKMFGPDLIRTVRAVGYALDASPHPVLQRQEGIGRDRFQA
jgi:two-component system, OmpR family, phosphate regulon response regulator PhoB